MHDVISRAKVGFAKSSPNGVDRFYRFGLPKSGPLKISPKTGEKGNIEHISFQTEKQGVPANAKGSSSGGGSVAEHLRRLRERRRRQGSERVATWLYFTKLGGLVRCPSRAFFITLPNSGY
jgi:hypothetical protein